MKSASKSSTGPLCSRGGHYTILLFALLFAETGLQAQTSYYWQTAPGTAVWNLATNWADTQSGTTGGVIPNAANINAVFDASSRTSLTFNAGSIDVASMIFNSASPAYTFTLGNGRVLSLDGAGVVNNSTTTKPVFNVNSGATLNFNGTSSAATATVTVGNGGTLIFNGVSSAGTAAITVNNSTGFSPQLYFNGTSTAGSANIKVNSGVQANFTGNSSAGNATFGYTGTGGGEMWFYNNTTASTATIQVGHYNMYNDSSSAGNATLTTVNADSQIWFNDTSSAGNATINIGTTSNNGGFLYFYGLSTGSSAIVNTGNGATVVISDGSNSVMTLGSIAGSGNFYLGDKTLTVGSRNLSTTLSGGLHDANSYPFATGGSLIKVGTGTLTLSGVNTHSGSTVIQGGGLLLANTDALSASTLSYNIGDGSLGFTTLTQANLGGLAGNHDIALTNSNGDALTISVGSNGTSTVYGGALSGAGMLIKTGTGTLTLSGTNTQAGGVQVTNGLFKLAPGATFGAGQLNVTGGAFDLDGGTFSLGNLVVNGGTVQNGTLDISTFVALSGTISAGITGGEFIKSGTASLTLSGANTYTGPTNITGGGLLVAPGSLPSGSYYRLNGGVIGVGTGSPTAYVSGTGSGQVSWEGDGGFAAYGGTRTVTFNGSGTQTWGQGGFVSDGSALILSAYGSDGLVIFANDIDFASGTRTVRVEDGSAALDATLSGVLTNGSLVKTGEGTLSLSGSNTYAGGTTLSSGTIAAGHDNAFGSGALLVAGNSSLTATGAAHSVANNVVLNATGTIGGTQDLTLAGIVSGTGALTKIDTNNLTLSGSNTYSGNTTASAGLLTIGHDRALGAGTLVLSGGTIQADAARSVSNQVFLAASSVIAGTSNLAFTGTTTNTVAGPVTLNITNTGTTSFGLLNLGPTSTARTVTINNTAGTTVIDRVAGFNGATSASILAKSGAGLLSLSGSNAYSGGTTISGGILRVSTSTAALGTGGLAMSGGNFEIANDTALNLVTSTTLTGSGTITSNILSGSTGVTHTLGALFIGAQTLTIAKGSNVTSGTAGIAFGNVSLTAANAVFAPAAGTILTVNNIAGTNRAFSFTGAGDMLATGTLAMGTSGLTKLGTGVLTLTGTASTYTGATAISAGTLVVTTLTGTGVASSLGAATSANGAIAIGSGGTNATLKYIGAGSTTGRTINQAGSTAGATLDASGSGALVLTGSITAAATAKTLTLTGTNSGANTISGPIVNGASAAVISLLKTGPGSWTLSGPNTFTGTTRITGGILNITGTSSLGLGTSAVILGDPTNSGTLAYTGNTTTYTRGFTVNAGGGGLNVTTAGQTLTVSSGAIANAGLFAISGSGNTTISSVISGTGSLSKSGSGLLAISGSNGFTGGTTISSGTLAARHNNAMGTSSITVNGGVFLVDTGVTVANTVNLTSGTFARNLGSGASLAAAVNSTSNLGGVNTTATILSGTTTGLTTLQTSFTSTSSASGDQFRLSDVYAFQGTGTDVFVMQLSFTDTKPDSYLGWINGSNQWVNAVTGNTGNNATSDQQGFVGSFTTFQGTYGFTIANYLGAWGTDVSGGITSNWAVLNHNSSFAVIPEPSTWALLGLGAGVLAWRRRRLSQPR